MVKEEISPLILLEYGMNDLSKEREDQLKSLERIRDMRLADVTKVRNMAEADGVPAEVLEKYDEILELIKDRHWKDVCKVNQVYNNLAAGEEVLEEEVGKRASRLLLWLADIYIWLKHNLFPVFQFRMWKRSRENRKKLDEAKKKLANSLEALSKEAPKGNG